MSTVATTADRSLLLDYISRNLLLAFYSSCRKGHWLVSGTTLAFILIKVTTILSTGLLVLQPELCKDVPTRFTATTYFNASNFDHGAAAALDSQSLAILYGVYRYGLPFPNGTNERFAFQTYHTTTDSPATLTAILSANVQYFAPSLEDCVFGHIEFELGEKEPAASYHNTSSSICAIRHISFRDLDGYFTLKPSVSYVTNFSNVICPQEYDTPAKAQRVLMAFNYYAGGGEYKDGVLEGPARVNTTWWICKPTYSYGIAKLVLNNTAPLGETLVITPNNEAGPGQISELSPWDVASGVSQVVNVGDSGGTQLYELLSAYGYVDAFFTIMAAQSNLSISNDSIATFTNPQDFESASKKAYNALAIQIVQQHLLVSSSDDLNGTYSQYENRIIVRQVPLRIMQGTIALLALLTTGFIFMIPQHVLPRSMDSIAAIAAVAARSPQLVDVIKGAGQEPFSELGDVFSKNLYKISSPNDSGTHPFRIEHITANPSLRTLTPARKETRTVGLWWRPVAFSLPVMLVTLAAPLVSIVLLETTMSVSSSQDGLANVDPESDARYAWVYIPPLVLISVATLYNMLDFETQNIQPFKTLARGSASADESLMVSPLNEFTPWVVWESVRRGLLAPSFTAMAVMVAPFLTIIVSGLLTVEHVSSQAQLPLKQSSYFNSNATPGLDELLPSLIVYDGLTYPQWTYDELAFPDLKIQINSSTNQVLVADGVTVAVDSPALRGEMNCSVLPDRDWQVVWDFYVEPSPEYKVAVLVPNECNAVEDQDTDPVTNVPLANTFSNYVFAFPEITMENTMYFAEFASLQCLDRELFIYGQISHNTTANLSVVWCKPYIQRLTVEVTYELPDFSVSLLSPPLPLEDTVEVFPATAPAVGQSLVFSGEPASDPHMQAGNDPFFNALLYGAGGVPPQDLLNASRLIEASNHLYRILAAQYCRSYSQDVDTNAPAQVLNGTYSSPSRYRLVQSRISTSILDGLLAALFICGIVTYADLWMATGGTRRVLPKNPMSIGAVLSLLAGAEMLSEKVIPLGTEWLSDKEMRARGVFDGYVFSLGWWGLEGDERYGIDIGRAEDAGHSK